MVCLSTITLVLSYGQRGRENLIDLDLEVSSKEQIMQQSVRSRPLAGQMIVQLVATFREVNKVSTISKIGRVLLDRKVECLRRDHMPSSRWKKNVSGELKLPLYYLQWTLDVLPHPARPGISDTSFFTSSLCHESVQQHMHFKH